MFDLRTHIRSAKTGKIVSENPYRLIIKDGMQIFERPPGSCLMYNPDDSFNEEESNKAKLDSAKKAQEAAAKAKEKSAKQDAEKKRVQAELKKIEAEIKEHEVAAAKEAKELELRAQAEARVAAADKAAAAKEIKGA